MQMFKGKRIFILTISFLMTLPVFSQETNNKQNNDKGGKTAFNSKSAEKELRQYIKSKNYSKADDFFKSQEKKFTGEIRNDIKLINYEIEVMRNLALEYNKNIYLGKGSDTIKYFSCIYDLYKYSFLSDSLDALPDKKGRIKYKYRTDNSYKLTHFRPNLRSAGKFFYNKKQYTEAFKYIDMYLYSHGTSLLAASKDTAWVKEDTVQIASIACLSAFAAENYKDVPKYLNQALMDQASEKYIIEIACKSYQQLSDTVNMINMLNRGLDKYPDYDFFFLSAIKYYNDVKDYTAALRLCERMTKHRASNRDFWFVKGNEQIYLNMPDSAIVSFEKAIELRADDAESYSVIGNIYLSKAKDYYSNHNKTELRSGASRRHLSSLYTKAMENFECSRKFAESKQELWYEGLRDSYFHLNKGRELRYLDRLRR